MDVQTGEGLLVREAAERLGVPVIEVFHLLVYRELRPRLDDGEIRVTTDSLAAYLERQRPSAT